MDASVTIRFPNLRTADEHSHASGPALQLHSAETPVPDETLIAQVCLGSKEALADLFRRYARIVRGVAYKVLRDASEADDMLQDIFLLVHRLGGTFDSSKGSARFWILQMTYRRAISRRRYLTSRHFYTHVDLDQAADQMADVSVKPGRPQDPDERNPRTKGSSAKLVCPTIGESTADSAPLLLRGVHIRGNRYQTRSNGRERAKSLLPWVGKAAEADFCWQIAGQRSSMIKDSCHRRSGCVVAKRTP